MSKVNNIVSNSKINTTINVIDSGCGSGKTSYAIQLINESQPDSRFIYITPFLSEVARVKDQCNRRIYEPNNRNNKGSKLESLKKLVIEGKDIASTHALFKSMDQELSDLIQNGGYTLILDEVMQVVETISKSIADWNMLIKDNKLMIDENKKVVWLDMEYTGEFTDIMDYALTNNLYVHSRNSDSTKVVLLVWTFPVAAFECFSNIYLLTYMFKGQIQRYYFDMYNLSYKLLAVTKQGDRYELVEHNENIDIEKRKRYKQLITIYEGNLNQIGEKEFSLSKTWLEKGLKNSNNKQLKNNAINYFINISKTTSKENMWTTVLGTDYIELSDGTKGNTREDRIRKSLGGNGYTRGFVACTARATNDYRHKTNCAYLLNRFMNPMESGFFIDKGITVDEDTWALGELIQWLFRSAIREDKEIKLYIPSKRMRNLLIEWLDV